MTYVMANLHGDKKRYLQMLDLIGFCDDDVLYVLGDSVDFGDESAELLVDMSMRPNIYPVAGEHDLTALRMLNGFETMLRDGSTPNPAFATEMTAWAADGGRSTLEGYRELDSDMREGVLDYLSEFALYEEVEAGGKSYLLVHGGIADFAPDKPLDAYAPEAFFAPVEGDKPLFADRTLVVGHVPTASGKIERKSGVISIDCGAKDGGALACLCLESGEEYYV